MKWGRRIDRVAGALPQEQARRTAEIAAQRVRVGAKLLRLTQADFDAALATNDLRRREAAQRVMGILEDCVRRARKDRRAKGPA